MDNMRVAAYIALLILALIPARSIGQEQDWTEMKDTAGFAAKLAVMAKSTVTIQSEFVQVKHMDFLTEDLVTKGRFLFKKENKIRWEYTEPYQYIIIMNDGKIFIKDGEKENKFDIKSRIIFNRINEMMLNTIQGKVLNRRDFHSQFFESEEHFIVKMTPSDKKMQKYVEQIEIYFGKSDYHVAKIKITEKSGDFTKISFINRVSNVTIDEEKFRIK